VQEVIYQVNDVIVETGIAWRITDFHAAVQRMGNDASADIDSSRNRAIETTGVSLIRPRGAQSRSRCPGQHRSDQVTGC
jgi:hypothetical protein